MPGDASAEPTMKEVMDVLQGCYAGEEWGCKPGAEKAFSGHKYHSVKVGGKDVQVFPYRDGVIVLFDISMPMSPELQHNKQIEQLWNNGELYYLHVLKEEDRRTLLKEAVEVTGL